MTAGPRRTARDIAARYGNFLAPMPYAEPGICAVCRRGVVGYKRCFKCAREPLGVGRGGADVVAMVSLAPSDGQLAFELVNYKRAATSPSGRDRFTVGLAAVLWTWLADHERCVAEAAGVHRFSIVTTVPSSNARFGAHPLVRLVSGVVVGSSERYRDLLAPAATGLGRGFSPDRFAAVERLSGDAVLVIDDTWTTGAHAHGAAAALRAAGAGPVAVVAIGRWYHRDDPANAAVERQLRRRRWEWDECMFDR